MGETALPTPAADEAAPRGEGETVLLVDDEKALVALGEEMLAELDEPAGFTGSVAALTAFRTSPGGFDIVLSDETMPEMTGTELACEIRLLRLDVPIILMSAYSGPRLNERAAAAGVCDVLKKPLQSLEIARCLSRALHLRSQA